MWARPIVCLVTDRRQLVERGATLRDEIVALESLLDDAIDAGVDVIQIRERDLGARPLTALASRVAARTRGGPTRVVVNDRADVALAAGADGVHLRQGGPPAARVRTIQPGWIIGRSTHEASRGSIDGAEDYVLFGSVFPSASKGVGAGVAGLAALETAVAGSPVRVVAIGGIDPEGAQACAERGAAGIAAIGVFLPPGRGTASLGPARAVLALREALARGAAARALR